MQGSEVITIERFIMEQERLHPEATGELSNLLYDLCLAAKIISRQVRRAGLSDILGPVECRLVAPVRTTLATSGRPSPSISTPWRSSVRMR